jgi:hypothetical protein
MEVYGERFDNAAHSSFIMNIDHREGWKSLKAAEQAFKNWVKSNGISIERVEHVATFEKWDKNTEIYIFFTTDLEMKRVRSENEFPEIENQYRQFLLNAKYPFDHWPVIFVFDSEENVKKNYEGNYFYRLR